MPEKTRGLGRFWAMAGGAAGQKFPWLGNYFHPVLKNALNAVFFVPFLESSLSLQANLYNLGFRPIWAKQGNGKTIYASVLD